MTPRILIRGLVLFTSLVALGLALQALDAGSLFDKAWIDADVRGKGMLGEALFLGAGAVFTAAGLPRQIVGFLAGYAFGLVAGTGLALAATVLGCILAFYYARVLGREFVQTRFSDKVRRIDGFLENNPLTMTLLIRLLPVGSNLATNLAAGVSSVRGLPFFTGSAVGYLPQTLIFALVGSGIAVEPELRISVSIVLFFLSGAVGIYLYRKHRHGKSFDSDVDRELGENGGTAP